MQEIKKEYSEKNTTESFAVKLKDLCKENNITIKQMLSDCHLNRNTIYDLEKKGTMISIEKLIAISKYFDVSLDCLLGISTEKELDNSMKIVAEMQKLTNEYLSKVEKLMQKYRLEGDFNE